MKGSKKNLDIFEIHSKISKSGNSFCLKIIRKINKIHKKKIQNFLQKMFWIFEKNNLLKFPGLSFYNKHARLLQ